MERYKESAAIIDNLIPIYEVEYSGKYSKISAPYSRRGKIYFYNGEYEKAEKDLLEAEKYQSIAQSVKTAGMTLLYIADLHIQQSDFVQALDYAYKSSEKFDLQKDYNYKSAALTSLGQINYLINDFEAARINLSEVLDHRDSISNQQFLIRPLLFMGMLEYEENNVEASENKFRDALEVISEIGSTPELARVYQYLCKIELDKKIVSCKKRN